MKELKKTGFKVFPIIIPDRSSLKSINFYLVKQEHSLSLLDAKAERIIHLIQSGCSTGSEIAQSYYKNTYYEQFSLVMSEIIGHLDYLEAQGRIKKELIWGIWNYMVIEI